MAIPKTSRVDPTDTRSGVPRYLLVLGVIYAATVPWETLPTPVGTPSTIAGLALLVAWGVSHLTGSLRNRSSILTLLVLFALVGWTAMSVMWSWAPETSALTTRTTLSLVLATLATSQILKNNLMPAFKGLAVGTVAVALVVIASPSDALRSDRTSFAGIDENILAFHLCLGLAGALFIAISKGAKAHRGGAFVATIPIFVAILLTGSRTGFGVAAIVWAVALVLVWRSIAAIVIAVPFAALSFVAFDWVRDSERLPARIEDWTENIIVDDGRSSFIDSYLVYFDEWALRGVGAGAQVEFILQTGAGTLASHSAFWSVWIQLGLVGLAIWAALLTLVVIGAWRSPARPAFILAAPVVGGFFLTLGPMESNMLWLIIALCLASFVRTIPSKSTSSSGAESELGRFSSNPAVRTSQERKHA